MLLQCILGQHLQMRYLNLVAVNGKLTEGLLVALCNLGLLVMMKMNCSKKKKKKNLLCFSRMYILTASHHASSLLFLCILDMTLTWGLPPLSRRCFFHTEGFFFFSPVKYLPESFENFHEICLQQSRRSHRC